MKKLIIPILAILALGLAVFNTFTIRNVKPVTISPTSVHVVQPKLVEQTGYDYSNNLLIGNKLIFSPVESGTNISYPKTIGQMWLDGASGHLRYWDGNSNTGVQVVTGQEESNIINFRYTDTDSANFPPLIEEYGWGVDYTLVIDSLEGSGATITFKQTHQKDSTYANMNETIFPFTIALGTQKFYAYGILRYQKIVIAKGSATKIKGYMIRKVRIGQ
jgi:hypothetical protein